MLPRMLLFLLFGFIVVMSGGMSITERLHLRDQAREMFMHGYKSYIKHAFPRDELKPLSCDGEDTFGGLQLTLVDSLDTLAIMGDHDEFMRATRFVGKKLQLDKDQIVSVFETNIRVLGGLLSAHLLANYSDYDGSLLRLARDLGDRLLPAFDTPTGIPYGSVNLRYGVPKNETPITCTAGDTNMSSYAYPNPNPDPNWRRRKFHVGVHSSLPSHWEPQLRKGGAKCNKGAVCLQIQ